MVPQERIMQRTVEQIVDVPMPQTVEELVHVPKIVYEDSQERCPLTQSL